MSKNKHIKDRSPLKGKYNYYQPKPEGHELVEGAKAYSTKDFYRLL